MLKLFIVYDNSKSYSKQNKAHIKNSYDRQYHFVIFEITPRVNIRPTLKLIMNVSRLIIL